MLHRSGESASEESRRMEAWRARYLTPVADCMRFRKYSNRLASTRSMYNASIGHHVFCCLTEVERESLAQCVARESCAFVTQGTLVVKEGTSAGLSIFLNRGHVACYSQVPLHTTAKQRACVKLWRLHTAKVFTRARIRPHVEIRISRSV
jgi:hypothetical protein